MRWLFCWLWLCCSGGAMAAALPLTLPANVQVSGSGFVNKIAGVGVNFQGAAFNSGLTTQVAGKAVTVPAAWRMASNAPAIGVAALRATPGFATAAVLSWLVTYGIEKCLDGTWCKRQTQGDVNGVYRWSGGGSDPQYMTSTKQGMLDIAIRLYSPGFQFNLENVTCSGTGAGSSCTVKATNHATFSVFFQYYGPASEELIPATETHWAAPSGAASLPDSVLNALIGNVSLPITPEVNPATQTVPLSDPYLDPVTGKRFQDVAYITPTPSAPTKTADLQVVKQEVDANGNPVIDPTTGGAKAPEETDDPCLAHPERLGCMEKGEIPAAPDLEGEDKAISIVADSGWGADTAACPADLTTTTRTGAMLVSFSFKPACDAADTFRPLVIGLAWLAAVLIALGVGRKGD